MVHIPRWRYWLSYLWEQTLETTRGEYNDYLLVSLVHGRLQLTAEEAIYSFGDYYLNFRKVFEVFQFSALPARAEVLILGLGLGSIPELLSVHHGLDYQFTAVEIDPVIVELAGRYSLPRLAAPVQVYTTDAAHFLQLNTRRFDFICMDVFQDATVPAELERPEFLALLAAGLAPNGALLYNRLAATSADRAASQAFFDGPFKTAFPDGLVFDTGGNFILLNNGKFLT
ncbi:MAG: fused MFS/spermidine synthase [Lewinella sp.]|nr:fused MFS/spermidine synthase [Lewinella sp.]